ncbi:hypothetical protein GCM10009596_02840 [Arthrobacter rhombi]|uniref:hypothetical protein n=1 Tax=Arthrobacter rhombi TaxID=71253 RepID=UPI0031D0FD17
MYVEITGAHQATIHELDNLRELKVVAPDLASADVASALEAAGWGTLDGDHAWLSIGALKSAGAEEGTAGGEGFAQMLGYAASQGWVSTDGLQVRAHLEC